MKRMVSIGAYRILLMAYVIVAVVVFSLCLLCDVPRRLVWEIWRKRR